MLIDEAKWFGDIISTMDSSSIFPMLDVGSSTDRYRKIEQPWIDKYIFKPARENNQEVIHLDIKNASGVDMVGDLTAPEFIEKLSKMKFKSVFCANLLEHIVNKEDICRILTSIVEEGSYIFVSCPYKSPIHSDPIDTNFRPNIRELISMFERTHLVCAQIVSSYYCYFYYFIRELILLVKETAEVNFFYCKQKKLFAIFKHLSWFFRKTQATCLVLRKSSAHNST
jgi:hypothetical protein